MALDEVVFGNQYYVKSAGKRFITCKSTNASQPKFRFYLEVVYDSKTFAYTFRANSDGYGFLNISNILQNIVSYSDVQAIKTNPNAIGEGVQLGYQQQNIHSMPNYYLNTNDDEFACLFSVGNGNFKDVQLKLYEFYSASATAIPVKQGSSYDGTIIVFFGYEQITESQRTRYRQFSCGLTSYPGGYSGTDVSSIQGKALNNTIIPFDANNNQWNIYCDLNDFGTLSFLNATNNVSDYSSNNLGRVMITYYRTAGNPLNQAIVVSTDIGGVVPANNQTNDNRLLSFGCFPANLNKLPNTLTRPQDVNNLDYYTIHLLQPGGLPMSNIYIFNIDFNPCKTFDKNRFAYINSFGVWEYINFRSKRSDKISKKETNIKKSIYLYQGDLTAPSAGGSQLGNLAENTDAGLPLGVAHRQNEVVSQNIEQEFTINTGYLDSYDIQKVKDMFISPAISILDNTNGDARGVILQNKNIEEVVVSHKRGQTQFALTFKYSTPTYNPILF